MHPDIESTFQNYSVYITNDDGRKTELGEIKDLNVSVDLANKEDQTTIHTFQSFEGSFKMKNIRMSKEIKKWLGIRGLTPYEKHLKRTKNRNKLYNRLKELGRKL